jgi:hypothetical protein
VILVNVWNCAAVATVLLGDTHASGSYHWAKYFWGSSTRSQGSVLLSLWLNTLRPMKRPHFVYGLVISWGTLGLFPLWGFLFLCYYLHASPCADMFPLAWVDSLQWNCWFTWLLCIFFNFPEWVYHFTSMKIAVPCSCGNGVCFVASLIVFLW